MDYKEIFKSIEKGDFKNLYLFCGQEKYLIENITSKLKEKLIDKSFEAFNYTLLQGENASVQRIIEHCETLPFMSEKRMILVRQYPFNSKQNEEEDQQICQYIIKGVPPTSHLVFVVDGDVDKRRKIIKEIKKSGEMVEFGRISGADLEKWISSKFKHNHKEISIDNIRYFIQCLDYGSKNSDVGLEDVQNEINKLISFVGNKSKIVREDIDNITSKSISNSVFNLINFIAQRDGYNALGVLGDIVSKGEPLQLVLFMISKQYKNILMCKILSQRGYSHQEIASKLSLHPFVVKNSISQGNSLREEIIKKALELCLETDISIKKGIMKDRTAVELLISQLCAV
jgi:DNA polymerase III subunit delta